MRFHRRRKVGTLLNIAPLVDCVFLLLIFFLLTSSFIEEAGLDIELPELARAATIEEQGVIISLSEKGELLVNGRPVSLEGLQTAVAAASARAGEDHAVLRADRDVRLGLLTRVMDEVKAAGIKGLDVQTIPPARGKAEESDDLP
jgi:biopolymer transport protein ExbD